MRILVAIKAVAVDEEVIQPFTIDEQTVVLDVGNADKEKVYREVRTALSAINQDTFQYPA